MTVWKTPNRSERYGIAIFNFSKQSSEEGLQDVYLDIRVGELVEVQSEYQGWYFGRRIGRDGQQSGIFPRNYIRIRECIVEKTGSVEVVNLVQAHIVQEITQTLREWGHHWKGLYVSGGESFRFIEMSMRALLQLRSAILSGTLPVDQLKKVERTAIYTIDKGNRELGMDLTVRSAITGRLIDPLEVSTCQLYNLHAEISDRFRKNKDPSQTSSRPSSQQGPASTYSFFVSVRNFVCKMSDDAELLMSLYDANAHKHFTESYVVRWSRDGLVSEFDQLHNLRVLFTDLGLSDIKREKVYLVCYVVRIGGMEAQAVDIRRSAVSAVANHGRIFSQLGSPATAEGGRALMRRPFGVAAMDISYVLSGQLEYDDDKHHNVPFLFCERDNLDTLLRKIIANKDLKPDSKTGHGLWFSMKLLHGDLKQIREDVPHLVVGQVSIARKMGFPEVILPGDARNDLYMTLVSGSFTKGGGKSTDRNIEVIVKVCDSHGRPIPGVISVGGGVTNTDEYNSVVYYHEDRPRWLEVFKICIPIEEFKRAHVVFHFRHRSSNELKDRAERPFALAYTPLMQTNGTTLNDTQHCLCVYKVDSKKWPSGELEAAALYLSLPSQRAALPNEKDLKLQKGCLSLIPKDSFVIETNFCSTKLTQNLELLGVLNWCDHVKEGTLKQSLLSLQSVPGTEVVKFLQDILDALFNILTQVESDYADCEDGEGSYDALVFECLLSVIALLADRKYQHFQPVLDLYIRENFCATLAYKRLLVLLSQLVRGAERGENELLYRSMKSLEYLVRFIVRSRQLHAELALKSTDRVFHNKMQEFLQCMVEMMQCSSDGVLTSQGACIKYLPATVPHLMTVFPPSQISKMVGEMFHVLPLQRLTKQRLMAVYDLVQGPLFLTTECRCILLPHITTTLEVLIQSNNELELCIRILSSILTLLFRKDVGSTCEEFQLVAQSLLRTVTQACVPMLQYTDEERKSGIVYQTISVLLEMMRQMDKEQYIKFMEHFSSRAEVLDFLSEMQALLKDLVGRPVYLPHWADMINLQNNIILNALRLFSVTLVDQFYEPFERQVWSNWFHLAISFVTQPALQLELLTPNQKKRLTCKYSDMRCDAAFEIRNMWFNLGQYKTLFVPCLVGPFLEMSLIPETELRKATIPLFFDMMQCEFNSSKLVAESYGDTKIDSSHCKAHFNEFENEMIHKLDVLVEGGQGDAEWRALFVSLVGQQCLTHATLREAGVRFVAIVGRLLDTLLTYRASHDHSSIGHRMQATTKLLDFYAEIERPQMYIRYVNKLCELQEAGECWTEAGLALRLHAKLLHWSDSPLPPLLCSRRHPLATTHRQLKEALFYDIVEYLERGKMWEMAVETCKEVARQCEEEVFDYCQLAELHDLMSRLYNNIVRQPRPSPEYFRVGYYGQGYPDFLRNRVFVYRGKEYERLTDFSDRMLNSMPKAELMTKLTAPGDDILLSPKQYLQINAVEPVMCTKSNRLSGKPISQQIMNYYMYNNVKHFQYSRPFHRHDEAITNSDEDSSQNEFASLWLERTELEISDTLPGIVQWFPVVKTKTYELCPLEVAIETMTQANKSLKQLVLEHKADQNLPLHPLSRKLTGMVDPAVMGGTRNYERAFLTEEYARIHPEHRSLIAQLKDLIATQIPLLEFGVEVHRIRAPPTLAPLHQRIAECFDKMRAHVHLNYGKKSCDLDKELPSVTMRRQILSLSNGSTLLNGHSPDNRLSEISTQTNDSLSTQRNTNSSIKHAITSSFNKQSNRGSLGSTGFGTLNFSKTGGSNILSMTPVTSPSRKRDKEKRRGNRKSETGSITSSPALVGASQWYTGSAAATPTPTLRHPHHSMSVPATTGDVTTPVFELRQELTASRPLRSEVERERRMSQRPNSIQSGTNSNRNSVGTTDSNISNEDDPPPLPLKASRSDSTYTKHSENEDSILQAINHSISETHTFIIRTSSVTELDAARSPVLRRQDYDTVLSPRGSFLYSSLQPNSRGHLNSNKEKAPTPPPKKRNQSSIVK